MNKKQLLNLYLEGIDLLISKIIPLPEKLLKFMPEIEDAWTIKEHVIHITDSEINGFIRCKSIIAQPGSNCFVMNEETWTKNIRRKNEDINKYLSVFRLIRELTYDLLVDEDEANWDRDYYIRNYHNETVNYTIEKCIDMYTNHLYNHIKFIDRNIGLFK